MYSQLAGALTNIIFDPLLIFGIGFFPVLGIYGAAIATVLGQAVSLSISLYFNFKKNPDIKISIKDFRPSGKIIGQIYKVGIPSILLSSISSVTTYLINLILGAFSTTAIAVYGVYFKLNSFIFMPVFGLNNGIVPIVAYNYGAKNKERLLKTIKVGTLMAVAIMTFGMLLFMIIPEPLLNLFSASESMLKIGIPAMRIISTSFIGAAIAISLSSVFQAFGKAFYSMLVSFIRQIFFLLPSAYLLSLTGNINNIWFCFPIAEIVAVILSVFFLKNIFKNIIEKL
jgi:putative MATE family efflux protein